MGETKPEGLRGELRGAQGGEGQAEGGCSVSLTRVPGWELEEGRVWGHGDESERSGDRAGGWGVGEPGWQPWRVVGSRHLSPGPLGSIR